MANVTLPNVEGLNTVEELKNAVMKMSKELQFILGNISWKNVNHLRIGLANGGYILIDNNGITVNNGAFDTFTVPLSGKVTMTGGKVQSSYYSYPRIEFDPDNKLFTAAGGPDQYLQIISDYEGSPSLWMKENDMYFVILGELGSYSINSFYADLDIRSGQDMYISAPSGKVKFENWANLYSILENKTLKEELDSLNSSIGSISSNYESRISSLESMVSSLQAQLTALDRGYDNLWAAYTSLDQRVSALESSS